MKEVLVKVEERKRGGGGGGGGAALQSAFPGRESM